VDFTYSDEQNMLVETAKRIGEKYGVDYWRELDASKSFPQALWQEICDTGLCGIALPEAYGGAGLGMLEMAMAIEALSGGGGGSSLGQMFMCNPIFGGVSVSLFGTDEQKNDMLPKIMSGDMTFCMSLTEPDAGSNSLNMKTTATANGNGWRLNGQKIWITCVPQASKMLVVARTTPLQEVERKTNGISLFIIDVDRPGLSHQPIEKVGTNCLPSSMVFFDDVHIDGHELVGTLDGGWPQLLDILNTERIVTTAGLVGTCDIALRLAGNYARDRKVFNGTAIGAYQGVQFPLAQAYAEAECARQMNHKAAWLYDQGLPYSTEANVAKLIAAQAAQAATERAMQTMGGMGYAKESHVERLWRDARLFKFAPVSEEMVLNFIAMNSLGLPRSY
jgi:acyl-CoA dehydrogenase